MNRSTLESERGADPGIDAAGPRSALDRFFRDGLDGIDVRRLRRGTVVEVHTRHSTYRCRILDGPHRTALVRGGTQFDPQAVARIDGCTAGGNLMKIGWIGLGLCLELSAGRRRIVTSAVQSIEIHLPEDTKMPQAEEAVA